MKAFERSVRTALPTLLLFSMLSTDIKAQTLTGLLLEGMASAQETIPVSEEAKSIELLRASLLSLSDKAQRDRRIGNRRGSYPRLRRG